MTVYLAHSNGQVMRWQVGSQPQQIGSHNAPVKDVFSFANQQGTFLVSGGWDGVVKFFKINQGMAQQIGETNLYKPVHYMSGVYPILVTAHSEKFVHIWNLENLQQSFNPIGIRQSTLAYATSAI